MAQDAPKRFLNAYIQKETLGGLCLIGALFAALFAVHSPLADAYHALWNMRLGLALGPLSGAMTVRVFINDVLMSLFFLLIGCEMKRELLQGSLASTRHMRLPLIAALGGMVVPALFYLGVCWISPDAVAESRSLFLRGWAIPTATDIAFALGVLGFVGARVPASVKVFLMALAVIDDLGAILLIGLFYTSDIHAAGLIGATGLLGVLWVLNRRGVTALPAYLGLGVLLWFMVHESGIHATLAGVLLALFIPISTPKGQASPLKRIESALHPYVLFGIMPLFALANAGVSLVGLTIEQALHPITLGIGLGLALGKPVGVLGAAWLARRYGWAAWAPDMRLRPMLGAACLCGIGFTMSLFIGDLAFDDAAAMAATRLGVLAASAASALIGTVILIGGAHKRPVPASG